MKRVLDQPFERGVYEELAISTGEFVALFLAALLLLGLFFSSSTVPEIAKTIAADERCWPEMLQIHYRDGGKSLSPLVGKYYLRKLAAPFLRWRRRQMLH